MADPAQLMSMPQEAGGNGLLPLYLLIGSTVVIQVLNFAKDFIKGLFTRTVEKEDEEKKELKGEVAKLESRLDDQDEEISELARTVDRVQGDVKTMQATLESIRATLAELRPAIDSRLEKQADFYRTQTKEFIVEVEKKLSDLEYRVRQDTTRAVADVQRELMQRDPPHGVRGRGRRQTD